MKRSHSLEPGETQKRVKSSLRWLGAGVQQLKACSSADSWHAAKQLVAEGAVEVESYVEDAELGCVGISGHITQLSDNASAFPHLRPPPALAAHQSVIVQLVLHPSTGQLLDAVTSCCPGGFQPVLGSFCPCATALLLCIAKQAQPPNPGSIQAPEGLPVWEGSSLQDVLRSHAQHSDSNGNGSSPAPQQEGLQDVYDALVAYPTCFTGGLGLDAWQYEAAVTATATVHVASQRNSGVYGYNAPRSVADPDKLVLIEEASEDLTTHPWFQNTSYTTMQQQLKADEPAAGASAAAGNGAAAAGGLAPGGGVGIAAAAAAAAAEALPSDVRRALMEAGVPLPGGSARGLGASHGLEVPGSKTAAAAAAAAAVQRSPAVARRQLLARAVQQWLTTYNGEALSGWQLRPKVVNDAFDLLVGTDSTPGRPLTALVLLLRGLWEYLHHHGLGRLLAKPLKLLMALRSVLLVGVVPLWARKAVCCQLEMWEKGLLWQHAATPLDASGGHVGLVHLLRVVKEVRQLCQHHWDEPHLFQLLGEAFAEQHGDTTTATYAAQTGSSSHQPPAGPSSSGSNKAAAWAVEHTSLLQLRLQALDAMGASAAYLELAMAGGAWREAINRLLTSKERSQLLKAVKLLTRHITPLPERLKYMSQIVTLDSLGAPERLEVTARLLLDLREQLHPQAAAVKVGGRGLGRPLVTSVTASPMWKVTMYSMYSEPAGASNNNGANNARPTNSAAVVSQQREHVDLQQAWSKFNKLFLKTAAEALFAAGEASIKSHEEHLKEEGLLDDPTNSNTGAAAAAAGSDAAAAAAGDGAGTSSGQQQQQVGGGDGAGPSHGHKPPSAERLTHVTRFFCPACNKVHDQEEPLEEQGVVGPQPGDPDWKLLAIDEALFGAAGGPANTVSIPIEAVKGQLTGRSNTGYLKEQRTIDVYKKACPPSFPQLLPLCGLDALCISSISSKIMEDFDAGGKLDTSLGVEPLRELLGHPVVEMGPGPVRLQAAIEAVAYASAMTPLYSLGDLQLDGFYRELVWELLGVGQRGLALLVSRVRYKVAPSPQAAGELLEVAIACGPEAQAAAVDLILGKGNVRALAPEDDPVLRELEGRPAAPTAADRNAAGGARPGNAAPGGLTAAELALLQREARQGLMLGLGPDHLDHLDRELVRELLGRGEFSDDDDLSDDFYSDDMEDMYDEDPYVGIHRAVRALANVQRDVDMALNEGREVFAGADPEGGRGGAAAAAAAGDGVDSMSLSEAGLSSGSGSDGDDDGDGDDGGNSAAAEAAASARAQALARGSSEEAAARAASKAFTEAQRSARQAAHLDRISADVAAAAARSPDHVAAPHVGSKRQRDAAGGSRGAGSSAAAAAAAAGGDGADEHHHHAADSDEDDGLASFDTRDLLGSEAAAVLQLRDTASSRRGTAVGRGAAGAAGDAAAAERQRAGELWPPAAIDDDPEDYYYGRPSRPIRNLPPAQPAARPTRQPRKRHHAAAAAAAAAAGAGSSRGGAAGGGGGGGDPSSGGGDGGGPSHGRRGHRRHHHSRPSSRNRRSGSVDGYGDPQQQALVSALFGITRLSHSQPLRVLRVHIHRLAGLQLWAVTKYAAGRGADKHQLQRLGMAAWLSDGNTAGISSSSQALRMSEALRWAPVASDQAGWLAAMQQLRDMMNVTLPPPPYEPYGGVSVGSRSWSGLPCVSWESFVAQQRYPTSYNPGMQHHDTPDANLAWLLAMLTEPESPSSNSNSGSAGDTLLPKPQQQQQAAAAALPAGASAPAAAQPGGMLSVLDGMLANTRAMLYNFLSTAESAGQLIPAGAVDDVSAALSFLPLPQQGGLQGYTYRAEGPEGSGYYRNPGNGAAAAAGSAGGESSGDAAAAAAAAAGSSDALVASGSAAAGSEGAGGTELLQQLASLSKGIRFGLPMLQLCHALMESGCRDACLELLPQALLPQGGTLLSLQLHAPLVADMQEMLPIVAKHGDVSLRVAAAVSYMLITRRPLPAPLINQKEVLSGVVSWWLGLAGILHAKPDDWIAADKLSLVRDFFSTNYMPPVSMGVGNWHQLQRMLIKSILTSLGGSQSRCSPLQPYSSSGGGVGGSGVSKDPNVLCASEGYQLLLSCEAVKEAHWAFRLYLARVCYHMRLATTWPELSALLCPALSAAVAEHTSGWAPDEREPLTDMREWKANRAARLLPAASIRARDWVAETLEWLATEVLNDQDRTRPAAVGTSAAAAGGGVDGGAGSSSSSSSVPYAAFLGAGRSATPAEKEKLRREFVDMLAATLSGWYGPELLLLAAATRPGGITIVDIVPGCQPGSNKAELEAAAAAAMQRHKDEQLGSLPALLQSGLLPRVGRCDELGSAVCVKRGQYRSSLRSLMGDGMLLAVLPQEMVRCLALTYWQQEATPEGFLTANEVLLRLEGSSSAQALSLPSSSSGDGSTGAAGAGSSAAAVGDIGLQSMAAGLRSFVGGGGGGEGAAPGMPQVHSVLLEQLDLVPSKGGIEAAGLRFMQLQRHAAKGQHVAALEAIFSSEAGSSGGSSSSEGPPSLSSHMEVVDAVLRLAADASSGNDALKSLMQCAPYQAIAGLQNLNSCREGGLGSQLLAQLSPAMQQNVLKLCIWRLVRAILNSPPPYDSRRSLGPSFVSARGGEMTYKASSPPVTPSYLDETVQGRWINRSPFNSLYGYCLELGLVQAATVPGAKLAALLCAHMERQEQALLWALKALAALLTGRELEGVLLGLFSSNERQQLAQLPVLMTALGETLKGADRKMMWAYATLKHLPVVEKIQRYIRRNAVDVPTLQRYLAKSKIAELQATKATSLPWATWELGSKAAQAQELAEWLYWFCVTWPSIRVAAGATRDDPALYTLY